MKNEQGPADIKPKKPEESLSPEERARREMAKEKIAHAKTKLFAYLSARAINRPKDIMMNLEISVDTMAAVLEIPITARNVIDRIVESAPGMGKTEKGYKIEDQDLYMQHFGLEATKDKILKLLKSNPDKLFKYDEMAEILNLLNSTLVKIMQPLVAEGRVDTFKPKSNSPRTISKATQFKIAEKK